MNDKPVSDGWEEISRKQNRFKNYEYQESKVELRKNTSTVSSSNRESLHNNLIKRRRKLNFDSKSPSLVLSNFITMLEKLKSTDTQQVKQSLVEFQEYFQTSLLR